MAIIQHQFKAGWNRTEIAAFVGEFMMFRVRLLLLTVVLSGLPFLVIVQSGRAEDKPAGSKKKAKPIDLLKMVDPIRHAAKGKWLIQKQGLISNSEGICNLMIPYQPPEEYDLEIVAERLRGTDLLGIHVPIGKNQPLIFLDGTSSTESGIHRIDGTTGASRKKRVFPDKGELTVVYRIRQDSIQVDADGETIIDWHGDSTRLSFSPNYEVPNKTVLALSTHGTSFAISKLLLTPVTGEGKRLK